MRAFIDQYRHAYGVEPICRVMQVAPSGYWRYAAQQRNPALRCARVQRDDVLSVDIERVWQANMQVYGADKVWRQLRREGTDVARCTVERLMRKAGLRGVMRGKVVRALVQIMDKGTRTCSAPAEFTQPEQLPRFRTEFAPEFPDPVGRTALCECDA